MKRPDGMPFAQYKFAMKRINARIDAYLRGSRHVDSVTYKPLVAALREIWRG